MKYSEKEQDLIECIDKAITDANSAKEKVFFWISAGKVGLQMQVAPQKIQKHLSAVFEDVVKDI